MNDIEKKREEMKKAYPGHKWIQKVKDMPDSQVIAVHMRLKKQNVI